MGYYDRYRGTRRKKRQNKLLAISIVLLILMVAAVAILVLGDHITYSADGFHFTWGSGQNNSDKPPVTIPDDGDGGDSDPDSDGDPDYIIGDGDGQKPDFSLSQGQTGSKLTDASLFLELDGSLPAPLNGYAVWVKDAAGNRYLPSAIDSYNSNGLWAGAPALRDQAAALGAAEGLHTVAVLNAFRDPVLPYKAYGAAAIDAGNGFWLDAGGASWLDPATPGGSIIVVEMIKRCKAAGFDEILLTDFRYPTASDGDISTITGVNAGSKASSLTAVAKQVKNTVGKAEIKLSCLLTATAAQSLTDAAAGQDVARLAQYMDCFYVETDDASIDLSALKAALAGTNCTVALWYTGDAAGYPTDCDFIAVQK